MSPNSVFLNIIFIGELSARPDDPLRNEMTVSPNRPKPNLQWF